MKRAEVWWADLPIPVKPGPVVILTRDQVVNSIGSLVVCMPGWKRNVGRRLNVLIVRTVYHFGRMAATKRNLS